MSDRRLFVLLAHDAQTGCATTVAGVLGVAGNLHHVSWVPYQPEAEGWRQRLAATTAAMSEAVEAWIALADGVGWDLEEIEPVGSPDLHGDVEAAMDELLAAGAEEA
jgi:hypothetical protein